MDERRRYIIEAMRDADEPAARTLLRQPMNGMIRVALTCEPDLHMAAAVGAIRHHHFIARDNTNDHIIGLASRALRRIWVNGQPKQVGYLSHLRRSGDGYLSRRLLCDGFAACAATRTADELPFDLTTIIADNTPARRLLERGLPGIPIYTPWCELVTCVIPTRRRRRTTTAITGRQDLLPALVACLKRFGTRHQFAPKWDEQTLRSPTSARGLTIDDFHIVTHGSRIVGCLARWDQRAFKQTVVSGYAPWLTRSRPLVNAAMTVRRRPRLPSPGSTLRMAYLSHLAIDGDNPEVLRELIDAARAVPGDTDYLVMTLAADHALLPVLRRYRPREYRSILYVVHQPEARSAVGQLDRRTPYLEAALL